MKSTKYNTDISKTFKKIESNIAFSPKLSIIERNKYFRCEICYKKLSAKCSVSHAVVRNKNEMQLAPF